MTRRPIGIAVLVLLLLTLAALIVPNTRSLYEGAFFYLRFAVFPVQAAQPISHNGRFSTIYDLIGLRNAERYHYILDHLKRAGIPVVEIPIPNYPQPDLLVTVGGGGPYTVYCAHYDKAYDDPEYQGASDNTAAVSVLLAAIGESAKGDSGSSRAFLFSGQEESGLGGAPAFVRYVRDNSLSVREVIDLDSLGRGALTIRPSADFPGFVFTLPFYGDLVFDGNQVRPSPPYPRPSARLVAELTKSQPGMVVLDRFTALSDSNFFQSSGYDTVAISADDMHYLQLAWDTYADRVDLLDEGNLDQALNLVLNYPPRFDR